MTVDVEDYFQVSAFEPHIAREQWERLPCRVERNIERILALFEEHEIQATFFVLGWMAERYPQMVRRLSEAGHEVASHGYEHVRVVNQTPEAFRVDIRRTKALLEDTTGQPVRGYRAASYSIGRDNLWALDELREAGHDYSSSIYPIHHDLYGMPEAPRFAFRHGGEEGILEVPVTTVMLGQRTFPCGGGGYFRLFPYALSRWALRRVNRHDGESAVFYFHPWEIDPEQPRQAGVGLKTRVRHYLNLARTEARLGRLLQDFAWGRMDAIFLEGTARPALTLGQTLARQHLEQAA
ncbi:XrtA system polysaccharide deacetylase [Halochromatium salexigens]|uniref:Polysaccharide deacetylase n=1 Tax=Halochromatium salexigens TaxID=49447 RepID=A0AAJ0XF25_HALSE|nr:XrtA system polysaccharide deacetylase [Halochromatium salexigens]MBK5930554.1 polysaccharide deacetylase [Halochromatium salexigens]